MVFSRPMRKTDMSMMLYGKNNYLSNLIPACKKLIKKGYIKPYNYPGLQKIKWGGNSKYYQATLKPLIKCINSSKYDNTAKKRFIEFIMFFDKLKKKQHFNLDIVRIRDMIAEKFNPNALMSIFLFFKESDEFQNILKIWTQNNHIDYGAYKAHIGNIIDELIERVDFSSCLANYIFEKYEQTQMVRKANPQVQKGA
jgi:hypothetical protein